MTQYPIAEVLERLKALLEKATPEMRAGNLSGKRMANILRRGTPPNLASRFEPNVDEDGELIAEAVNALPALLTHLDAVEGENARLRRANDLLALVRGELSEECNERWVRAEAAESQLASQAASLAEMRAALEPFAAKWAQLRDPLPDGPLVLTVDGMDCCRARQALQNKAES